MKTINRRQLNHGLAQVLDEVLETHEPVRVEGRDGRAVVISAETKTETPWERWNRLGLIEPAKSLQTEEEFWADWAKRPPANYDSDWLLAEMAEDR